jgi:hypothetical protein
MWGHCHPVEMSDRVDEFGRAYAGSQLQIQTYVNRRQQQLNAAILGALPELAECGASLQWVSPLERDRFAEYQDDSFLAALDLLELAGELADFWPQGGPKWDALAKIHWDHRGPSGVLLLEAKSYPKEMFSGGCLASEVSRTRIIKSLDSARAWLGADAADWTGPLYQYANRLAHLYFLRGVAGIPTWFVNACFAADPHRPTPVVVWEEALKSVKASLGFGGRTIPYCADVILEATGRELFQMPVRSSTSRSSTSSGFPVNTYGPGKEWRFLRNDRTGRHQFLAFANARGSSSLRYFDAESGLQMGDTRYGRKNPYQMTFARELEIADLVMGPRTVSNSQIAPNDLVTMRAQVGLTEVTSKTISMMIQPSILAGVDAIVDRALGVSNIGGTAPHYRHLTAYRAVVNGPLIDGKTLIDTIYRRIVANWPGTPVRGDENWRWEKKTYMDERNSSPEKRFEKTVATECVEWYNMIPVASGVLPEVQEGGRRIDLARQCSAGWLELVELKVGDHCDTPLHAAVEIIGYGLIYLFSRRYRKELGYDSRNILLSANRISLKVLAPAISYSQGSLASFEAELNRGLAELVSSQNVDRLTMDFRFEQLPANFELECACKSPCEVMTRRSAVYP